MHLIKSWLVAFRLRTLPLALSTIFLGSFLAAYRHHFQWSVLIWAVLTTLFLQILSNLANDYGDTVNGVDNHDRKGPKRSLQAGTISLLQMKTAIIILVILSLISGVALLVVGTRGLDLSSGLAMFVIGILAIIAAMKYTMGKNPYGYAGLGDIGVFIFFGLVGVLGSYFLHTHKLTAPEFLPALTMGFFSTGVLNLNNLRDRDNDAAFGKRTLVVMIGIPKAKIYHAILIIGGMLAAVSYSYFNEAPVYKWIYLLSFPFFIRHLVIVFKNEESTLLDPELKRLALATLLFSLLFGVGLIA